MDEPQRNRPGRRRHHHTHEINDPYAEGWDARDRIFMAELARAAGHTQIEAPMIGNPYRFHLNKLQDDARVKIQIRAAELWDQGWTDRETEVDE